MDKKLVSVIIPVYNAQKRLAIALESLLKQSYQAIEVLLINDGSTDDSLSICNRFASQDARIRVINQANAGVSAARNKGIQHAKGHYIMFLDADDSLQAETIQEGIHRMALDQSDLAIFGMHFDYYQGNTLAHSKELTFHQSLRLASHQVKDHFFSLYEANYLSSSCNKIFKSAVIRESKIAFEEDMAILEDFTFVLDYLQEAKAISVLPQAYYHYYNDLSTSQLKRRPQIDYMKNFTIVDDKLRAFSKRFGLDAEASSGQINSMIFRYYLIAAERLFLEDKSLIQKHKELKHLSQDRAFKRAVRHAKPSGFQLVLIHRLFKHRMFSLLSLLFWLNHLRQRH